MFAYGKMKVCESRAASLVWRALLAVFLCALLAARGAPACAAPTVSGTLISNPQAQISGTANGISFTVNSVAPAGYTIMPEFGLDGSGNPGNNLNNSKTITGGYADYVVGVKNSGNAPENVGIKVSVVSAGGAVWDFQVDDAGTFGTGLLWQGGGSIFTSSNGTINYATAAVMTPAGGSALFTIRVRPVSGANHGATLQFDIALRSGDKPIGVYTGRNSVLYGGVASLSTSRKTAVALDTTPPTVAITAPTANSTNSGVVSVTGSAYETNFSAYTLSYGPGTSPAAWGTIQTATTAVNNGALGSWDTHDLYGVYTLRLNATDTAGNSAQASVLVNVRNTTSMTGTLPKDTWTMVSFPGIPSMSNPRDIFGAAATYEIQQWDPSDPDATDYMKKYKLTFSLDKAGEGFWVKPYGANLSYNVPISYTDTSADYAIPLTAGWNQIGCPYNRPAGMQWQSVNVWNAASGTVKTLADANAAGWIDLDLNEFENGLYVAKDTLIFPGKAYFVRTYTNVELRFNPAEGRGAVARIVRPRYEWKMNLAAETETSKDTDNTAAVVIGAGNEYDKSDSGEPPSVEPYISLYFDNSGWKRNPGRYKKDFKPPLEGSGELEWPFVIETSEPGSMVTLSAPDASELPGNYSFIIRDEETGKEFDPRVTPEYEYRDSGGRRGFTLKAGKLGALATITLSRTFPPGWSLFSVPLEPEPTEVKAQLSDDLDNIQVFQYYDAMMYHPGSPEHVDIQAGLGYWLHLDNETELDFTGVATDISVPIEIPLVKGWNLVGNPYTAEIQFGVDVQVRHAGMTLTLQDAIDAGILAPEIYGYDNNTGGYESWEAGTPMSPWMGYAVKALQPCTIIIRAGQ